MEYMEKYICTLTQTRLYDKSVWPKPGIGQSPAVQRFRSGTVCRVQLDGYDLLVGRKALFRLRKERKEYGVDVICSRKETGMQESCCIVGCDGV
jgi:hypothetical protein